MNFSSFVESIVHSPTPEGKNISTNSQDKVKQSPTDQHLQTYRLPCKHRALPVTLLSELGICVR